MQLNNFYERDLWTEWSKRMTLFASGAVRRNYYPNNMDSYYDIEKRMVNMRREQIYNAKQMFDKLYEVEVRAAYYQLWKTKCGPIRRHDEEPIYGSSSDKIEEFFNKLSVLENERLEFMYDKLAQLNAAKALLRLRETTVKEEKHKVVKEKRAKTIRDRKVQEPVRRSNRVQQNRKREVFSQVD
jgi:hypothetical protein